MLTLRHVDAYWLMAAAICILTATAIGGFNAYLLLSKNQSLGFGFFMAVYWLGWAFSLITPGQIGDIATISTVLKKHQFEWHTAIGRSLLDKLISLSVMLVLAIAGLYLTGKHVYPALEVEPVYGLLVLGLLLLLLLLIVFSGFFSPHRSGIRGLIGKVIAESWTMLWKQPWRILFNALLTVVKVGLIGSSYWCVFNAADQIELDLMKTVMLSSASSLVAYVPISLNGMGTVEVSGLVLFSEFGLSQSVILAGYLCLRAIVFLLAWLPASLILLVWRLKAAG